MEHTKTDEQKPVVKYDDLEMALSFVSDSYLVESTAYVCRKTGKIFWESSEIDDDEDLPDDVDDSSRYAIVPHQSDLDLGKRLVMRFISRMLPDRYDQVSAIFRRPGAYSRYKELLDRNGLLEQWYDFENSAIKTALCDWAEDEGFKVKAPPNHQISP